MPQGYASRSGIGRATAELLAGEGAHVAVAARGQAGLDETVATLESLGAQAFGFAGDLAAPGVPEAAVAATVERFGQLDALVANVGFAVSRKLADVTDADWEACFQGNLMSHIRATRAALPHLRRSDQARVVLVSSTAGKRPSGGMPDYSVMKAALLSYSKAGAGRPIGRMAEAAEIADVIALLCSARSSYVTGSAWGIDGGTVPVII